MRPSSTTVASARRTLTIRRVARARKTCVATQQSQERAAGEDHDHERRPRRARLVARREAACLVLVQRARRAQHVLAERLRRAPQVRVADGVALAQVRAGVAHEAGVDRQLRGDGLHGRAAARGCAALARQPRDRVAGALELARVAQARLRGLRAAAQEARRGDRVRVRQRRRQVDGGDQQRLGRRDALDGVAAHAGGVRRGEAERDGADRERGGGELEAAGRRREAAADRERAADGRQRGFAGTVHMTSLRRPSPTPCAACSHARTPSGQGTQGAPLTPACVTRLSGSARGSAAASTCRCSAHRDRRPRARRALRRLSSSVPDSIAVAISSSAASSRA